MLAVILCSIVPGDYKRGNMSASQTLLWRQPVTSHRGQRFAVSRGKMAGYLHYRYRAKNEKGAVQKARPVAESCVSQAWRQAAAGVSVTAGK
jgi:hypothetical protein